VVGLGWWFEGVGGACEALCFCYYVNPSPVLICQPKPSLNPDTLRAPQPPTPPNMHACHARTGSPLPSRPHHERYRSDVLRGQGHHGLAGGLRQGGGQLLGAAGAGGQEEGVRQRQPGQTCAVSLWLWVFFEGGGRGQSVGRGIGHQARSVSELWFCLYRTNHRRRSFTALHARSNQIVALTL